MDLRKLLLIAFMLSGMAALIYELTWIRPLQFLIGSTVYTISIIFAAFMLGLAIGSLIASKYADKIKNLPATYALIELGIGLYGVSLLSVFNLLPRMYNSLYFLHSNFYLFQFVQFALVFTVLLIPTTLMGATFPVIAKFYTQERIGKGVGEIYSANNVGAIIGSFGAGFILIPLLGIKASIIFAGTINLLIGFVIISLVHKDLAKRVITISLIAFIALAFTGDYNIKQMHSGGFYKTHFGTLDPGEVVYYEEGLYATVSVRDLFGVGKALYINGKGQGSSEITDLRVNFLLAYLPILIKPGTENTLVIGLGTGTTSGQLAQVSKVTTVEIEPKVIGAVTYFRTFNMDVLDNPNHKLVIGDGRNYLLRNKDKYDVIIPEPSDPWQSFSTALFSKEFLDLASQNLEEGGLYLQWVPAYQMSVEDFKNFYRTFNSVFPYTAAFANIKPDEDTPVKFGTSEIILIGSKEKIELTEDKFKENYESLPEQSKKSLGALKLNSGDGIYHLMLFTSEEMQDYAKNAKIITDDKPILEFSTAKNVLNQNPKEVIGDIEGFIKNE